MSTKRIWRSGLALIPDVVRARARGHGASSITAMPHQDQFMCRTGASVRRGYPRMAGFADPANPFPIIVHRSSLCGT